MKFQRCSYKAKPRDEWRLGVAKVKDWGVSDVEWIVDAETGKKAATCYDYVLGDGPLSYMSAEAI